MRAGMNAAQIATVKRQLLVPEGQGLTNPSAEGTSIMSFFDTARTIYDNLNNTIMEQHYTRNRLNGSGTSQDAKTDKPATLEELLDSIRRMSAAVYDEAVSINAIIGRE